MKIKLYPKDLLEAAWRKDKKLYADGDAAEPPQCLRCGAPLAAHLMVNALSRYADVQICEACGMDEALRDAVHTPLPLAEWDAVKRGRLTASEKGRICYLDTTCTFEEVFRHTDTPPMQLPGQPVSEVVYSRSDYDGYETIVKAHEGDPDAIDTVLSHYAGYIRYCSKVHGKVNAEVEEYVKQRLIAALFKFRFD